MTAQQAAQSFQFSIWTNDNNLAVQAHAAGIRFVALDFEVMGKRMRQPEPSAWISDHRIEDIPRIREVLNGAELLVRANPPHDASRDEIRSYVEAGADAVMLPMFETVEQVADFVATVGDEAEAHLLLETPAALVRIQDIVAIKGISEISLGLNDLHRSLGLRSHFELLLSPLAKTVADRVLDSKIRFGFGTVLPPAQKKAPIDPDYVIAQYPRLGGQSARLASYFIKTHPMNQPLAPTIAALRARLAFWFAASQHDLELAAKNLQNAIEAL